MSGRDLMFAAMGLIGLAALIAPRFVIAQRQRLFARRLANRERRGTDAYFEEERYLKAYAPTTSAWKTRVGGAALVILAGALLASDFLLNR